MSERTPGPWHVNKFMDDDDDSYSIDDDTGQVAKTYCEGNAKLIAAAPELLEALVELLAAELAIFPSAEAGKEAQDAWADRRAAARNNASSLIARVS